MDWYGAFIEGRRASLAGTESPILSPVDGRQWATVTSSSAALDEALASSATAKRSAAWSGLDATARARVLLRLADLLEQRGEEFARLEVLASGKTRRVTAREANRAAAWFRFYAGAADKIYGGYAQFAPTTEAKIVREPVGLVAAITPTNGPLSLGTWKIAPALATGNCVLVKPPLDAPGSTLLLAELAAEAGLPDGTLNVVPGGAEIGEALVRSPEVDMVTFTGSTTVARKLASTIAGDLRRFVCEAGGKSAQIVFEDANLDDALVQARQGVFSNAGQSCVAGSRLLVQRSVYEGFLERLVERTQLLRIGDPFDEETHVGPLSSAAQLGRVREHVEGALSEGLSCICGGGAPELPEEIRGGYYFTPTIFRDVSPDAALWNNEIFGPVLVVTPFADEDEAVALANRSNYGLAAGLWTRDISRAQRVSRQLQAGTVWVNTYRIMHYRLPFGGYKQSGIGRENGLETLNEYLNVKTIITEEAPPTDALAY